MARHVSGDEAHTVEVMRTVESRSGRTACTAVVIAMFADRAETSGVEQAASAASAVTPAWSAALALGQEHPLVLDRQAHWLLDHGQVAAGERLLWRALDRTANQASAWREHLDFARTLVSLYTARGDVNASHRVEGELAAWVRRDGRPAVRYEFEFWRCCDRGGIHDGWQAAVRLAEAHHARQHLTSLYQALGSYYTETGDPAAGIPFLRRAVAEADTLGFSSVRVQASLRLGRAYAKAGRVDDAVATLHRALQLADPGNAYYLADLHHNLAHAFEAAGRMTEAMTEADRFVSYATRLPGDAISLISLRDAGVIRWEAGLHVSARAAFDSMVRVIDWRKDYYYYAGEYYERIGNLALALHYYRLVGTPTANSEEGARTLAGLARVFDALGMPDSAETAARAHDRAVQTPDEVPLMPGLLAGRGRLRAALALSRAWADTQIARGNVRGAGLAELALAHLLAGGPPGEALAQAVRAEGLARGANLVDARIGAQALETSALLRLGRVDQALRTSEGALITARQLGTNDSRLGAELARGDALAAAGRADEALAAYDAAARLVDGMSDEFEEDLARSRLRARQLEPFDDALRLLLRRPPSAARTDALLRWSERRKGVRGVGRAFAAAAGRGRRRGAPAAGRPPVSLGVRALQQRLGAHRALVDYVLLDSVAVALVVTNDAARVVPLPASTAELARLVVDVRRPLATVYMGRVDLARATVDPTSARALYRALIAPLEPLIDGRPRLTIVPDGPLHLLPFDVLPIDDSTVVVDRYAVSLLPSARVLDGESGVRVLDSPAPLLAVGGDAPGADAELRALRQLWTAGRVDVMPAESATAAGVREAMPRYTVLHFATHAVADDRDPLSSRLLLRGDGRAGGVLQVSEIEKTPSHAELVVLSACETQSGQVLAGVGPMGLARSFLASGSHAVIATEWPVGATAADLMRIFYSRLAAGDRPDDALRASKATLRRRPQTSNPFHWAGFVLVGDAEFRFAGPNARGR